MLLFLIFPLGAAVRWEIKFSGFNRSATIISLKLVVLG